MTHRPFDRLRASLGSGQAIKVARHEWAMVLRDPRFLIPFAAVPLFLILLHSATLFMLPGNPSQRWLLTRSFLDILSLIGASMAVPLSADAFAGEKERQTWETLLCLPIRRGELFLGKVLGILPFPLLVGWTAQIIILILSNASGTLQYAYSSEWIFALLLTPFLSLFFCALSALISLRSETVRSAAQFTGLCLLILFPLVTASSQALLGNFSAQAGALATLLVGAALCFTLAVRRLKKA